MSHFGLYLGQTAEDSEMFTNIWLSSKGLNRQGSKFHLQVRWPGTSGFSAGQLRLLILLSVGQPGSRQDPSLVSARQILVSDFNGIPLLRSRQA